MKFSELREADLSKAQIKKVHDKADDLPKNDFIKRYGKDGDAVRFATATNIVKKQLGIDESIIGVNKKSVEYKNGRAAAEKGIKYDKNPHAPGTKRLNWSSGHNDFRADALRKAGKPNYGARGQFEALDKEDEKSVDGVIKQLKKAVKAHQSQVDSLTKDIKDEVELDEVHFSNRNEPPAPKGMHKLRSGRDIPSTPQVDKIHKKVVAMTDRNDHSGARIEIAKACGDKKLVQIYNALELAHDNYSGAVGNGAIELRNKFSPVLNKAIERKFGKYADVIQDAL